MEDGQADQQQQAIPDPHAPGGIDGPGLALVHAEHHDRVIEQGDRKKTGQEIGQDLSTGLENRKRSSDQCEEKTTAGKGDATVPLGTQAGVTNSDVFLLPF